MKFYEITSSEGENYAIIKQDDESSAIQLYLDSVDPEAIDIEIIEISKEAALEKIGKFRIAEYTTYGEVWELLKDIDSCEEGQVIMMTIDC